MMIIMLRYLVARHLCSQQIFYLENLWCPGHGHLCHQRVSSQLNCAINLCNQIVQATYQHVQSTCPINLCNQMCPGDGHLCHQHVPRRRSFLKDRSGRKLLPNKQVIFRLALFPLQYFILPNKLQIVQHL